MVSFKELKELVNNLKDYELDVFDLIFDLVFVPTHTNSGNLVCLRAMPQPGTNIIRESQFENNPNLKLVFIDDSVEILEDTCFGNCILLKNIKISPSVKEIGNGSFINCSNLSKIYLPDSVTELGFGAFQNCCKLKNVRISKSIDIINEYLFYNCIRLSKLYLPDNIKYISDESFCKCRKLEKIRIGNQTEISYNAFYRCKNIKL